MVHTQLTVDVWNVHISQLKYSTRQHYGRQSEHEKPTKHSPETT